MWCNFEHDFLRIFVDMGCHLGTQDGAKIEKKGIKNKRDFKTKLEGRPAPKKGRNVVLEPLLAHPHMRAR